MTEQQYEVISRMFHEDRNAALWLIWTNKVLTAIGYVSYALLLALVALDAAWAMLVRFVVVPALGFFVLSKFRSRFDAPRPYEVLDIDPIIIKDTQGRSFPSRHIFSMMMIACSWIAWDVPIGIVLGVCCCVMAIIRVIGGVHFPRDVVAGACFAIACALIGYVLIPL